MSESIKRFGNWHLAGQLVNNLAQDIDASNQVMLKRIGLWAEKRAVEHLQAQDLGWTPLAEKYAKRKDKEGKSNKILIRTSSYFQSITSWTTQNEVRVGVKKTAKNEEGEEIANIAKVHEYGSAKMNIPARPLWRPVYSETVRHIRQNNLFAKAFLDKMRKKYGVSGGSV